MDGYARPWYPVGNGGTLARTESATVKMEPVDEALLMEAGRRGRMSTPQYLLTAGLKAARSELPADVVAQIERRHGVTH